MRGAGAGFNVGVVVCVLSLKDVATFYVDDDDER